ncbi:MAG: hypothetical protein QM756_32720 [Polyangiaceae bacterium]
MSKSSAQVLGALAAVVFMGWLFWVKLAPARCPGGVFVEFHPPLSEPGPFQFRLALEGAQAPCTFDVPLPLPARVDTSHCGMAVELKTLNSGKHASIAGLTFAAAPKVFSLEVRRNGEKLYDSKVTPHYSPYPTKREENKRFCGEQAFVQPACLRGSSECAPFRSACDGPEDCDKHQVCCASPESAREYGKSASSECSSRRRCVERYGHIGCHADADCAADERCAADTTTADFEPPLLFCQARPNNAH